MARALKLSSRRGRREKKKAQSAVSRGLKILVVTSVVVFLTSQLIMLGRHNSGKGSTQNIDIQIDTTKIPQKDFKKTLPSESDSRMVPPNNNNNHPKESSTNRSGSTQNTSIQSDATLLQQQESKTLLPDSHSVSHTTPLKTTTPTQQRLPRFLAILFPQYHPDPLNDRLWGPGFTDWDNLEAAPTHNRLGLEIPRPIDPLGYYDMRNATVRKLQGELAKQYGLDGFVYHHYWFYDPDHPGPNLQAPLTAMLKDGYPDLSFFLNWADSSWADTWLGKKTAINTTTTGKGEVELQKQYFPDETDPAIEAHYQWLRPFFHHSNYIRVQGQPVFMVYLRKVSSFPILKRLRQLAEEDGFPGLYLLMGMSVTHEQLFQEGREKGARRHRFPKYLVNKSVAYPFPLDWTQGQVLKVPEWCRTQQPPPKELLPEIPGILTSFDNTPRRDLESAHLWSPDPPPVVVDRFHQSLSAAVHYETCCLVKGGGDDDRFVLINSWNEWAEGMCLEPSTVFGRTLLQAVQRVKQEVDCSRPPKRQRNDTVSSSEEKQ